MIDTQQSTDRDLARITAHTLRTAQYGWYLNLILFMISMGWGIIHKKPLPLMVLELGLQIVILYYLLRVQLDAPILKDVSNEKISLANIDDALTQLKLRKKTLTLRTMQQRCQACMRLFKIFWLLTVIYLCIVLSQMFILAP